MVDNEQLEVRGGDDVKEDTSICRSCSDCACTRLLQLGTTVNAAASDCSENDSVINAAYDKSTTEPFVDASDNLRHIVIDGSNIAMSHGNRTTFSCRGIQLAVNWFRQRGHENITVFVPQWRRESHKQECTIADPQIMSELEREKILVFTPSRKIGGKRIVCYDDRYIVKLAAETDGVIVSNDTYRDLIAESPDFRKAIEERLLMYSFVNDRFMPPDDPLGRNGPSLDNFLRKESVASELKAPDCPYAKCTFGAKCRFSHPEKKTSSHRRASPSPGRGGKTSDCGNTRGKTKLTRSGHRSYETQKPNNEHLNLKPFRSDPTDSSFCGHLALARKLSHEVKAKDGHPPTDATLAGQGGNKHADDAGPEKLHQQLSRQMAIQGSSDPRAVHLAQIHRVSCSASRNNQDAGDVLDVIPADMATADIDEVSNSFREASMLGNITHSVADSLSVSFASCSSSSLAKTPKLPLHPLRNDSQQFPAARAGSQDHVVVGGRLASSPFVASVDNTYRPTVCPTVLPYNHRAACTQLFPAPVTRQWMPVRLSPCPQMLVCQSRSYRPLNEHMRPRPVITAHRFMYR